MSKWGPWKYVSTFSEKYQGVVWVVERKGEAGKQQGYFKFQNPENIQYGGPMIADEMIAAKLAKKLKIPIHELECTTIDKKEGVVSIVKDAHLLTRWDLLPKKVTDNIPKYFKDPKHLINMFVFDVWTCNTDRGTNKNIIVYQSKADAPYEIYLIDHNHALHDANLKWNKHSYRSAYWKNLWRYYKPPTGVQKLVLENQAYLKYCVKRVRRIKSTEIKAMIESVPAKHLRAKEAHLIYQLLRKRQRDLPKIIQRWMDRVKQK